MYVVKLDHSMELQREERREEPCSSASELLVSENSVLSVSVLRTRPAVDSSAMVTSLANGDGGFGLRPLNAPCFDVDCLEAFGVCRSGALEDIARLFLT